MLCSTKIIRTSIAHRHASTAQLDPALAALNIKKEELTHNSLKSAYIKLAKRYHPDLVPPHAKDTPLSQ